MTAVGAAGAAGIGNGADVTLHKPNVTANSQPAEIAIEKGTAVRAFSDGTRFAIDTEKGGIVQEGVADHVLQGTFMQGVLTAGQVTELVILMEGKGQVDTLTLPENCRSFALTVDEAGVYFVYIANGALAGKYAVYNIQKDERCENGSVDPIAGGNTFLYTVGDGLSDNYYLHVDENNQPEKDPAPTPAPTDPQPPVKVDDEKPEQIEEEEVPMTQPEMDGQGELQEFEEEEIPLAGPENSAVPKTGDGSCGVQASLSIFAGLGLLGTALAMLRRRMKEEA